MKRLWTVLFLVGILVLGACTQDSPEPAATPTREAPAATATPTATLVPTATPTREAPATTATPTSTPTPTPTATPTATPTPSPTPTPTATPTPTPTPIPTPTPTPTPLPLITITTTDTSRFGWKESGGIRIELGYGGTGKQLSKSTGDVKDAPNPVGVGYYGVFPIGIGKKANVAVMLDITESNERGAGGTLYVGTQTNGSLTAAQSFPFQGCCADGTVSLTIDYGEETAPLEIRVFVNAYSIIPTPPPAGTPAPTPAPASPGSFVVNAVLNTMSVRMGKLPEAGAPFFITDEDADGVFELNSSTQVLQDLDGDNAITQEAIGDVQYGGDVLLPDNTKAWEIYSISPSGRTVQLLPKAKGVLAGKVRTFVGAKPIAGATIQAEPGGFKTQTDNDGSYRLEVYSGNVWKLLVKNEGYIPFTNYYSPGPKRYPGEQQRISVRAGGETSLDIELAEIPEEAAGTATLSAGGSFFGALGLMLTDPLLGDFRYDLERWSREGKLEIHGFVCACHPGQRGIVQIGDKGQTSLDQITIPPFGYTSQRIELQPGFVYVAKAREGLEGHFVVFRADSITQEGAKITYLFR